VRRWFQFGSKSVQRESRRFDTIGAARMTGRGVTRVLYTWYNPLRVSLPLVRETFPRLCGRWLFSLFVVRSVLIRLLFVSCYVATRSLVTFVSSVLAEGALECDHNL
jgi:hypothetical protein